MEATRRSALMDFARLRDEVSGAALAEGLASQTELDAMAEALRVWGEYPDAFYTAVTCYALGWA